MAAANPLWGAPRIHGELLKLGINVAERTVLRLLPKGRTSPSQAWRTFLANHVRDLVSLDFFTVPTQQIVDAFPDDSAPSYLLRDRDSVYGHVFRQRLKGMGVGEVLTAPHSPWQNPFAERLIGSIRRECLNHVVVLGEQDLRRTLARYFACYHGARTHLALDKDAPDGRPIEPPGHGTIIPIREVGGLHHRYVRRAA
jgi:putative transposase